MDKVTRQKRSEVMASVCSTNTKPEIAVRKIFSSLGLRYRLNARGLPGKPDLSNKARKIAVFVHGCFWHWHKDCKMASMPLSNKKYWAEKFLRNTARDQAVLAVYKKMGWRPLVIWECEIKSH